jgi:hypothetical protein
MVAGLQESRRILSAALISLQFSSREQATHEYAGKLCRRADL